MTWKPDKELVDETVKLLKNSLEALPRDVSERLEHGLNALECIGTMIFLDRDADIDPLLARNIGSLKEVAKQVLGTLDGVELESAAGEILRLAPELDASDDDSLHTPAERVVDALRSRDSAELVVAGLRRVLGDNTELPLDHEASMMSFDEVVEEELWRLLPLGPRRSARCSWAAPSFRRRLWWWHRGDDLPADALHALGTAARVIHLFPQAREELERLVAAEGTIDGLTEDRGGGELLSGPWQAAVGYEEAPLEQYDLAAASEESLVLLKNESFVLVATDEALLLDLEEGVRLREGTVPIIRSREHGEIEGSLDEEIPGEYSFPAGAYEAAGTELVVPLQGGDIVIEVPKSLVEGDEP